MADTGNTPFDQSIKGVPKITSEQKALIDAWIADRWIGSKACPVCGQEAWVLADYLGEVRTFNQSTFFGASAVFPQLVFVCKTCGHTLLINAIAAGVIPPAPEPIPDMPKQE